ncbi:agamous-like MADS-box protein AGL80 [Gossypium hirsutum]|uniref:Agamous-like MADS-box protein AGL80 n=1 Tax=Gossypium hirsutum TaxID=3635 RepID=A0A1U8IIS4_GOSHI|nr:agamous-like MADS-box protein AGL80 [Gossypium hirsutum]
MSEMSTLCGVDTCAIMYSPYKSPPEVWPSPMGVQQVLSKLETIPEMEKSKNMLNQKTFLSQKITKAAEQLKNHWNNIFATVKSLIVSIFGSTVGATTSSDSGSFSTSKGLS